MAVEVLEVLSGTPNGSNVTFTSSQSVTSSPALYINGVLYADVDTIFGYSVSGTTWTLTTAPSTGDVLLAYYIS